MDPFKDSFKGSPNSKTPHNPEPDTSGPCPMRASKRTVGVAWAPPSPHAAWGFLALGRFSLGVWGLGFRA